LNTKVLLAGINSSLEVGQLFGQPINRRTSNDRNSFLPPPSMALAGPVASLLSSGPIVTTPGSTEIKPSTVAIKNQTPCPIASRPVYDLRNQCSQFVCNCWFYPSLEDHFSCVPDPTQLEIWLSPNEARILCHVVSRRHTLHTGQQRSPPSPNLMSVLIHSVQFRSQLRN
jgi:hypothetical protein